MPRQLIAGAVLVAMSVPSVILAQSTPRFSLPLECKLGETCFLQNMVDMMPGSTWRDPGCGGATFNGHKGTDFRLVDLAAMRRGANVLAVADGKVLRARDGVTDKLVETKADRNAVRDRECGNGLIIDHGGGWQSQYCHMAKGSLKTPPGTEVKRGDLLGLVGLSGQTQFPHVHVTFRKGGKVVDPMTGQTSGSPLENCGVTTLPSSTLWETKIAGQLSLAPAAIIGAGLAGGQVDGRALLRGKPDVPTAQSPLVVYGSFINLRKDDRVRFEISGPDGVFFENTTEPVRKNKASFTAFAGRRTSGKKGASYRGKVWLIRNGAEIAMRKTEAVTIE